MKDIETLINEFEEAEEKRFGINTLRVFKRAGQRGAKKKQARRELDRAYDKKR